MMVGKSDHEGCFSIIARKRVTSEELKISSVTRAAPAPSWISRVSVATSETMKQVIPACCSRVRVTMASRSVGARTRTRSWRELSDERIIEPSFR